MLGTSDRLVGAEGSDRFFVTSGGEYIILARENKVKIFLHFL